MLVTPYPGAGRDDVLRTLREIESAAHNVNQHSGFHGSKAYCRLTSYLEWATTSVRMLEHRVSAADIDQPGCSARRTGLTVKKLTKPLGVEPEDTRGKKTRQPTVRNQAP